MSHAVITLHFSKLLRDGRMQNVMARKKPSVGKISFLQ